MAANDLARRAGVWLRRYGPAELAGTAAAIAAAALVFELCASVTAAALAANWAEFAAYYGLIFWRSLPPPGRRTPRAAVRVARDMAIEFGAAELVGGFLLRPLALYAAMALAPSLAVGALLGKLAADLCFYLPAVLAYELRARLTPAAEPAPHPGGD